MRASITAKKKKKNKKKKKKKSVLNHKQIL